MTQTHGSTSTNSAFMTEQPLIDDIRYLGQLLGDTIREQDGAEAFERIESVRRLSVAFERAADPEIGGKLDAIVHGLTAEQAMSVIRAFSYFSHLANIAEDRHHIRRRAALEDQVQRPSNDGSLASTFMRLAAAGVTQETIAGALGGSLVSPVLTAHPTEVQRKSLRDAERSIARLLAARESLQGEREKKQNEALLRGRIAQLWQTRLLRYSKLSVRDEIENALGFYQTTFLQEIPRLYDELEERLGGLHVAPFFRMGSWIGGDRDGNPNVNSQTLSLALRRQCETALRHYLLEIRELSGELSISSLLVGCTPELQALADRSGDENPHREDEPYRRALIGVDARLSATLLKLTGVDAAKRAGLPAEPYLDPAELLADLDTVETSLAANHGGALIPARLKPLRRAVDVFGFHLATVDLRQSSDRHQETLTELLAVARVAADYASLDEARKQALLLDLLRDPRPLRVPGVKYSARAEEEIEIFAAARDLREAFGGGAIRYYIVSHTETVSDLLEPLVLLKECGMTHGALGDADFRPNCWLSRCLRRSRICATPKRSCAPFMRCRASPI